MTSAKNLWKDNATKPYTATVKIKFSKIEIAVMLSAAVLVLLVM